MLRYGPGHYFGQRRPSHRRYRVDQLVFHQGHRLAEEQDAPSALDVPVTTVSGNATFPVAISGDLSSAIHSIFAKDTVWMRIVATGTNSGLTPVTGKGALTALVIRVVLQDKIL